MRRHFCFYVNQRYWQEGKTCTNTQQFLQTPTERKETQLRKGLTAVYLAYKLYSLDWNLEAS